MLCMYVCQLIQDRTSWTQAKSLNDNDSKALNDSDWRSPETNESVSSMSWLYVCVREVKWVIDNGEVKWVIDNGTRDYLVDYDVVD